MAKKVRIKSASSAAGRQSAKDRLIAGLASARQNILDKVAGIPSARQDEVFLGEWSIKDLIAHLIGWDHTYLAAVQDILAGELPSFYAAYDADWESYNVSLIRQYEKGDWTELQSTAKQSNAELVDYLRTLREEDMFTDWGVRHQGTPVTVERLVDAETEDEREHFRQINRWIG